MGYNLLNNVRNLNVPCTLTLEAGVGFKIIMHLKHLITYRSIMPHLKYRGALKTVI